MKHVKPVGEEIDKLLKELGIRHRVDEQKVILRFEDIMGSTFCKRARAVRIEKGVLFIEVISSAWRQELYYQKSLIRQRINDFFQEELIREIVFR